MNRARGTIAAVLLLIGLPPMVAIVEAVSFHVRNRNNGSVISSGEKREYVLHVPPGLDRAKRVPLVISLHGAGGWGAQQRDVSRWNRLADERGFIVVYPSAVDIAGPRTWRVERGVGLAKDVRFIAGLIDRLEREYAIDSRRIYANGLSNGGGMSFVLSCAMSDRIAAVGTVAAAQTLPWNWCADERPVPMIAFHGTDDPIVPYEGGSSWIGSIAFPDVAEWTAEWARRNRCAPDPVDSPVTPRVTRRAYANCAVDSDVVLYTLRGGGHTWPGGMPLPEWLAGSTSEEIDATRLMWEFFEAHPLRSGVQ